MQGGTKFRIVKVRPITVKVEREYAMRNSVTLGLVE